MYTQTEKSKTNQLKANGKFLKDFSTYKTFPDGAKNANINEGENISLKYIKNDQLLLQTKNLVQKERQINIQVIQHLQEIEKRKLYLDRGFSSLFEYVVKELGYSHSAAYRRIKSMRLCRDIPQAASKIKTGSLNLTTASQLQTFFEKKKRKDREETKTFVKKNLVLEDCLRRHDTYERIEKTFKTNGQAECNLQSTFLPATECVTENEEQGKKSLKNSNLLECNLQSTFLPAAGCVIKNEEQDTKTTFKLNSNQKLDLIKQAENQSSRELEKTLFDIDPEVNNTKEKVRDVKNDKVEIKMILDKELQQKLELLKKLLSHKNPNMSYGELISVLAEMGLNKYDPKRKIKKQSSAKKQEIKIDKQVESNKAEVFDKKPQKTSAVTINQKINNDQKYLKTKRYISSKVRRHVWMRDQGKCTYVCPKTKRKCISDHLLQIDHIKPFSLGGTNEADNLRLLCASHNQFMFSRYQKKYG